MTLYPRYGNISRKIHAEDRSNSRKTITQSIMFWSTKYPCDFCEYKTKTVGDVMSHMEVIQKNVKYNCRQCEFKTTRQSSLKTHYKSVHRREGALCNQYEHSVY